MWELILEAAKLFGSILLGMGIICFGFAGLALGLWRECKPWIIAIATLCSFFISFVSWYVFCNVIL